MTPLVFVVAVAITAVVSAIIVRALAGRQLAETRGAMAAQLAAVEQDNKWLRDEVEQSKYAFGQVGMSEGAFAAFHRDLFDKCYDFSKGLIDARLLLPALDYCLKCSHLFNVLDASGSIGVTERTAYILKVRQLAVAIAREWVGPDQADAQENRLGS